MGAEIHYSGRITFNEPVPTTAVEGELAELLGLENLFSLSFTPDNRALTGLVAGDGHIFGHTSQWCRALYLLEEIARREQRLLTAEATWFSEPGPFRGILVVDTSGRFHDVVDGEPAEHHRQSHCTCYAPRER
ncbi:hypothetical protein [Streptomyces noursei]|uniref:hypothetical protein n=1 Tax=Streptomyces noursei TaxID=1971 RepID=UPI00167B240E|nr:hypothetical protein [Streptomyces noursei]MCZ1021424.1 hypothetical protein [Streptomyces noursei]GGX46366.1 hypothetical protein GCM10010341_80110 [Streptomyces noursei]